MKDEIKEILDKLKDCVNNPIDIEVDQFTLEAYHIPNYFCLDATTNDCKVLLDHITNLQETNKRLQNRNIELVLENDRLKENNNAMQEEMARTWKKLDKVTEYINTHYLNANEPELSNILQGEDKDVKD